MNIPFTSEHHEPSLRVNLQLVSDPQEFSYHVAVHEVHGRIVDGTDRHAVLPFDVEIFVAHLSTSFFQFSGRTHPAVVAAVVKLAKEAGADVSYFDEEPYVPVKVPGGVIYDVVELPKPVVDADVVISTAKMKTHSSTVATLCIKNLHGLNTWKDKRGIHKTDLGQKLVDIVKAIQEKLRLSVVDGICAMEGLGPSGGFPVDMGLVLAGDNIVAVDAVASACMGIDPMEVPTTQIATYQGLGPAALHEITVKGENIEAVMRPFKRAVIQFASRDPNVTFYLGGACLGGCIHMAEPQYDFVSRDLNKKYAIIVGMNPVIPRKNLNVDEVWVVGDCAISCVEKMDFEPRPTRVFEGCPPLNDEFLDDLCRLLPEIFPEGHPRVSGRGIWVSREELLAGGRKQKKNQP